MGISFGPIYRQSRALLGIGTRPFSGSAAPLSVYAAAHLNDAARDRLYPLDDPRRLRPWVHYLGLQAEWWFNSTYRK